jgi:nicotinamidase-related amidase
MTKDNKLQREQTALVVIDVQGKLAQLMHDRHSLFDNLCRAVQGAQILDVPIVVTEQYPEGLGPTISQVTELLPDFEAVSKTSFSCCGDGGFNETIAALHRRQLLLAGIETHICVQQTTLDLLQSGYEVHVIADAVSSRTRDNKQIGIEKMRDAGAVITCTEAALYELLGAAGATEFKRILELVK